MENTTYTVVYGSMSRKMNMAALGPYLLIRKTMRVNMIRPTLEI